ncbi:MAG: DUF4349 domain-containing protein [Terrimesophilobacter sp.]
MKRILVTAALILSVFTLAGCSLAGTSSSDTSTSGGAPESAPGVAPAPGIAVDGAVKDAVVGPQIITTVQLTVTVDAPITAADEAARIVARVGGTVADRSERAASEREPGSAQLTLRIPSDKLTATLDDLKKLGVARDTSINSTDVTAQSQDLDARITALQTSVDRLLALMSKATTTADLITIESALSDRQANLESLQSQKRGLDDQVSLSTVTLYLISQQDTPKENPDTFWTGLVSGWNSFVGFLAGVLVVVGILIPWIAAAGIAAGIALLSIRSARRRKSS